MAQICDRCHHKTTAKFCVWMTQAPVLPSNGEPSRMMKNDLCQDCTATLIQNLREFMNPPLTGEAPRG